MAIDPESIEVGFELTPLVKYITDRNVYHYSARYGGLFLYTMHSEKEIATKMGFDNVIMQGSQSLSYASEVLFNVYQEAWFTNSSIEVKFIKPVFPNDILTVKGIVRNKIERKDEIVVECDIWAEKASGEKTMVGSAEVGIPRNELIGDAKEEKNAK